jgi:hypothetical protein
VDATKYAVFPALSLKKKWIEKKSESIRVCIPYRAVVRIVVGFFKGKNSGNGT